MRAYVSSDEPFRIWWERGGLMATGMPFPEGRPFVCRFEMPYDMFSPEAEPVLEELWAKYTAAFKDMTQEIERITHPFEWSAEEDPPRSGLYVIHGVCMAIPCT